MKKRGLASKVKKFTRKVSKFFHKRRVPQIITNGRGETKTILKSEGVPIPTQRIVEAPGWREGIAEINRRQEYQERIEGHPHELNLEINTDQPYGIYFTGDWHLWSEGFMGAEFQRDMEMILNAPNCGMVLMGDEIDDFSWLPGAHEQLGYPAVQMQTLNSLAKEVMEKNKLVSRIGGNHCVSSDTEALTRNGWKHYNEISIGDEILTYSLENKRLEYKPVEEVYSSEYSGKMYHFNGRTLDLLVSPEHNMLYKQRHGEIRLDKVENMLNEFNDRIEILQTANYEGGISYGEDEAKLVAWLVAEGNVDGYRASLSQMESKSDNVVEIDRLIKTLIPRFARSKQVRKNGYLITWRFPKRFLNEMWGGILTNIHNIPDWIFSLDRQTMWKFLDAFIKADGTATEYNGKLSYVIGQKRKEVIDDLQRIALLCGFRTNVTFRKGGNRNSQGYLYPDMYNLIIRTEGKTTTRINNYREEDYSGIIWCPRTVNKTFIARRNGKVAITGNTNEWILKSAGLEYFQMFQAEGIPSLREGGFFNLQIGEVVYRILCKHRVRYNSSLNKLHANKRMLDTFGHADVVMRGHTHDKAMGYLNVMKDGKKERVLAGATGTYKGYDRYGMGKGFEPSDIGGIYVIFDPKTKYFEGFDILEKGLQRHSLLLK